MCCSLQYWTGWCWVGRKKSSFEAVQTRRICYSFSILFTSRFYILDHCTSSDVLKHSWLDHDWRFQHGFLKIPCGSETLHSIIIAHHQMYWNASQQILVGLWLVLPTWVLQNSLASLARPPLINIRPWTREKHKDEEKWGVGGRRETGEEKEKKE